MHQKKRIEKKLDEIFSCLKDFDTSRPLGLFSGNSGVLLFLAEYFVYTGREDVFLAVEGYVTEIVARINSSDKKKWFALDSTKVRFVPVCSKMKYIL